LHDSLGPKPKGIVVFSAIYSGNVVNKNERNKCKKIGRNKI
jgi:hypothetical protein